MEDATILLGNQTVCIQYLTFTHLIYTIGSRVRGLTSTTLAELVATGNLLPNYSRGFWLETKPPHNFAELCNGKGQLAATLASARGMYVFVFVVCDMCINDYHMYRTNFSDTYGCLTDGAMWTFYHLTTENSAAILRSSVPQKNIPQILAFLQHLLHLTTSPLATTAKFKDQATGYLPSPPNDMHSVPSPPPFQISSITKRKRTSKNEIMRVQQCHTEYRHKKRYVQRK